MSSHKRMDLCGLRTFCHVAKCFFPIMLDIYNLIPVECFQWRAPRANITGRFTPRCAPLRALAWG